MNVITANHECKVVEVMELQYVDVGNGIAAYKTAQYSKALERGGKLFEGAAKAAKANFKPHYQEGFCLLADAILVSENKASRSELFKRHLDCEIMMATSEFMDSLLKYGVGGLSQIKAVEKQYLDIRNFKFQDVVDGKLDMSKYQPIFFDGRTNMMYDIKGNWITMGLIYNYMNGQMDNTKYDLQKVLNHLEKHPQVRFPHMQWGDRLELDKDAKKPEISSIPYYNCSDGRGSQLVFVFMPTVEQMKTLQTQYKETYLTFDGIRRVLASEDMLGIEQFRLPDRDYQDDVDEEEED